eukprot:scaffold5259_cov58-Attheya_sp.AAC.4
MLYWVPLRRYDHSRSECCTEYPSDRLLLRASAATAGNAGTDVLVASAVAAETPFARNWRRSSLEVIFSGWPSLSDTDAGSALPLDIYVPVYVCLRLELALRLRLEVLVWKPSTTLFDSIMTAIANRIR